MKMNKVKVVVALVAFGIMAAIVYKKVKKG